MESPDHRCALHVRCCAKANATSMRSCSTWAHELRTLEQEACCSHADLEGGARKVQDSGTVVLAEVVVDVQAEEHAILDPSGELERIESVRRRVLRHQICRDGAAGESGTEKSLLRRKRRK